LFARRLPAVLALLAAAAWAQELTIAAASHLQTALPEVVAAFERSAGKKVRVSFGSSGNLFAQIQNGAPFDLFFSADVDYARRLEAAGMTRPGSLHVYAVGRIVVWVPHGSPVDLEKLGMRALLAPEVKRIAIANPAHAPYGVAAEAALRNAQLYEAAGKKLVVGENVAQAAQFAHSRNADLAIVGLSAALSPEMQPDGAYYVIPQELYPPLRQAAILTKGRWRNVPATRFLSFLRSAKARAILVRYGFNVPEPTP